MIARVLDFIGSARTENERINTLAEQLARANTRANIWQAKCDVLTAKLAAGNAALDAVTAERDALRGKASHG